MDKIVVTPAGETPPPLGVPFPEDMEFRKLRLNPSTVDRIKIDTSSIYSFSVNTSNMDLCSWTLVNIPMLKEMTLNTFCGGCPIRLVGYEVPNSNKSSDKHADKHPHKSLNYVFNLKITSVDTDKGIELNLDPSDEEVEEVDEPLEMDDDGIDEDTDIIFNEEDEDDDDMEDEGSEERSPRQWAKAPRFLRRHRNRARSLSSGDGTGLMGSGKRWRRPSVDKPDGEKTGVRGWIRKEIGELFSSDGVIGDSQESLDIEPTNDYFMEGNEGDLRYCPACIEFADHRKDGRKRFMYIFPYAVELSTTNRDTTPKLRSYQEFSKLFPICKYGKLAKNARMSQVEKLRRQLVVSYRALLSGNSTRSHMNKLEEFLGTKNDADRTFLENSSPVTVVSRGKYSQRWEGSVAMATERRHWVEKTLLVSSTEVCILRHADSRRSSGVTISLKSVLCVRPLSREEAPFPGFEYFQIETFARVFVIMVRSTQECEGWIRVFVGLLGNHISETPDLRNHPIPNLMESADIFFGRPNSFKLDRRRVFNYRRIIFHPASGLPSEILAQTPNELVEGILDKAFELVACGTSSDAALWVEFMDRISALQTLDISGINEKEKISLLLNLYHSMVLHGFLLLGPPVSQSSWASFFNSVSYLVSYDVISINELEHNGLRSSMCKPSAALLSKKIGAKASNLGSLALGQKDFRLNFCINCGSRSIPGYVPIYYPQTLDRQMDEMTALVLAETCHIDTEKKTAVLPRICSWYLKDFSKRNNGSLPIDCLRVIMPYLRELDKHALLHMLEDGISPNIRFRPFAFRCRPVAKLET